ncbi:amidohydrolase family protein [Pseudenhygromyxa sp. WMMC2535]|uniref:amidohydrolase family protein n=1 Tax=Pseudenhygromyxa sp. WMMC2535 TaxID=2712867 RepID=UPI001552A622|nr:amidohydrolase family protein [Pseudenhygromyxa sp. WMMC2535]NVB37583.1 amidohydrolase family protein [Pseudenhygromyxa sp. WMMC2535]
MSTFCKHLSGLCLGLAVSLAAPASLAAPPAGRRAEAAAAPAAESPVADKLLLTHARIFVGDGSVIEDGAILIEGGKITKVGAGVSAAGVTTMDLGGKLVTPGLIAADTQLGLVEISLEDSTRDESRRDEGAIKAGYDPSSAINADSSLLAIQAVEGVTTAAVAPHGGLISGEIAWIDLLPGAHGELVAASAVGVAMNFGRSYAGSRAASLAELRRALDDAAWYRNNEKAYERGAARELVAHPDDLRALWPVLDKTIPLVVRAHRASDLLALGELASELDLRVTVVGGTEAWKVREQLAAAKIHVVLQTTHNLPGSFDTLGARLDNAALLDAAGVPVAIAHFDSHNARNLTQEAGIAVANGLDPKVGLQAITANVAAAYGMDADYGTVTPGKVASLVIWDGDDPLEFSTWAEQVIVRGHSLEMRSRQTQLRERYMDLSDFPE